MSSLADKLDHLFGTYRRPDGKKYTYDDVEQGTGGEVSHTYVWKLHKGQAANPGYRKLAALAAFFGVPITYFYDVSPAAEEHIEDLQLARALREDGVQRIALRARVRGKAWRSLSIRWASVVIPRRAPAAAARISAVGSAGSARPDVATQRSPLPIGSIDPSMPSGNPARRASLI